MSLHTEWMRFQKLVLTDLPREDMSGAKSIYYCGAAAMADMLFSILANEKLSARQKGYRINAIANDLEKFRKRAKAKGVVKK
jgi:hypothetical protein